MGLARPHCLERYFFNGTGLPADRPCPACAAQGGVGTKVSGGGGLARWLERQTVCFLHVLSYAGYQLTLAEQEEGTVMTQQIETKSRCVPGLDHAEAQGQARWASIRKKMWFFLPFLLSFKNLHSRTCLLVFGERETSIGCLL